LVEWDQLESCSLERYPNTATLIPKVGRLHAKQIREHNSIGNKFDTSLRRCGLVSLPGEHINQR